MKILTVFLAAALAPVWAQPIQFPASFEKLADKATESNTVNLDGPLLQLASEKFASKAASKKNAKDSPDMKELVKNLKAVQVRNFEFAKAGEYTEADVAPVREQLKGSGWVQIVSTSEKAGHESAEIYVRQQADQITGFAVIAMEPKELTVVHIDGQIDVKSLASIGVPNVASKIAYDLSRQVPAIGAR